MKPAPYSFWCSKCKVSHAGECADQPGMSYLSRGKPAIGTRWVQERRPDPSKPWAQVDARVWEVTGYPDEKHVSARGVDNQGVVFGASFLLTRWTDQENGSPGWGNMRYRMRTTP